MDWLECVRIERSEQEIKNQALAAQAAANFLAGWLAVQISPVPHRSRVTGPTILLMALMSKAEQLVTVIGDFSIPFALVFRAADGRNSPADVAYHLAGYSTSFVSDKD